MNNYMQSSGMTADYGLSIGAVFTVFETILVIALTVYVIVLTINHIKKMQMKFPGMPPRGAMPIPPSLLILNDRFARGEINEEDYKRIKSEILR